MIFHEPPKICFQIMSFLLYCVYPCVWILKTADYTHINKAPSKTSSFFSPSNQLFVPNLLFFNIFCLNSVMNKYGVNSKKRFVLWTIWSQFWIVDVFNHYRLFLLAFCTFFLLKVVSSMFPLGFNMDYTGFGAASSWKDLFQKRTTINSNVKNSSNKSQR